MDFAILLGWCDARSGCPFHPSDYDCRRLAGPGGARSVVAESVLVKQQLLILNRPRKRSPNLRVADRVVAGLCALLMRPGRLICSAIVLKPSTLLGLHRALKNRKYRLLFSPQGAKAAGPKGTEL